MNEMKTNDYGMSMRCSNRARSIPDISVQRKPRRVQTIYMKGKKNEKDESGAFIKEKRARKSRNR